MSDNRKFTISWETADMITKENLLEAYKYLEKENAEYELRLETTGEIEKHNIEDMMYNKVMLKHLKAVLKYYGESV